MMLTPEKIKKEIASFLKLDVKILTDDAQLTLLVRESFVLVEMVMYLQDEFSVRIIQDDLKEVKTVGDLIAVFQRKSGGK